MQMLYQSQQDGCDGMQSYKCACAACLSSLILIVGCLMPRRRVGCSLCARARLRRCSRANAHCVSFCSVRNSSANCPRSVRDLFRLSAKDHTTTDVCSLHKERPRHIDHLCCLVSSSSQRLFAHSPNQMRPNEGRAKLSVVAAVAATSSSRQQEE